MGYQETTGTTSRKISQDPEDTWACICLWTLGVLWECLHQWPAVPASPRGEGDVAVSTGIMWVFCMHSYDSSTMSLAVCMASYISVLYVCVPLGCVLSFPTGWTCKQESSSCMPLTGQRPWVLGSLGVLEPSSCSQQLRMDRVESSRVG